MTQGKVTPNYRAKEGQTTNEKTDLVLYKYSVHVGICRICGFTCGFLLGLDIDGVGKVGG